MVKERRHSNMGEALNVEPFDPKKHKPIDTVGGSKATEYLASEVSPEGRVGDSQEFWNIPTIWYDRDTGEPVFLGGEGNEKAWRQAFIYEKETGIEFPRYKDVESAVAGAKARSNKGGATNKSLGMAKGGLTMKKMYEEGGLATDGLEVDPVSGNDIPPGSNAEDVRDDVDAQLSSGEYVVPADVVKYFGVSYFEKLREKAKAGLEAMDEDGRMGGEPVEHTLESDLKAADGYAAGGMVKSTDVDGIIKRVREAALKDPSVSNMLKSKGIFVQGDVAAAKQFNTGGTVGSPLTGQFDPANTTSNYNPYAYTPGFSAETGVTGEAPTVPGTPAVPSTDAPQQPVTCPPGFVYDATTNSCVVDPNAPVEDKGRDRTNVEPDPEAWMNKYDYTDPNTLFDASMTTLGMGETDEEQGIMGKLGGMVSGFFDKGILGKLFKTQKYAEVMANANVLESHGYKDQANKLREAAGGYATDNGIKVGGFFDSTKTLTNMAMDKYGKFTMGDGKMQQAGTPTAGGTPTDDPYLKSSGKRYQDAGLGLARKVHASSPTTKAAIQSKIDKGDARGTSWKGGKVASNQSKPGQTTSKSTSGPAGQGMPSASKPKSVAQRKESAAKKYGGLATGGRATGGLVSKPHAKAKKPVAKKTTTKKGLGRK